ncbi:MAG: polysaccharide biosynthesis protein [Marinoscillum sp.]
MSKSQDYIHTLKNQRIFITGGTGTLGVALVNKLLKHVHASQITIYSRDEHKQLDLERKFPGVECLLGDVRDRDRLDDCIPGHDILIHLAALKQLPRGESNATEFTKTNILGTENVLKSATSNGVKQVLFVSSDKAVLPTSHYGSTKLSGEKLMQQYASRHTEANFPIVRLGNIWQSRGSISELLSQSDLPRFISITDTENSRFSISAAKSAEMLLEALRHSANCEIFIPKMYAFRLEDLVKAADLVNHEIVGLRPGERKHELLASEKECSLVYENEQFYVLVPDNDSIASRFFNEDQGFKRSTDKLNVNSEDAPKYSLQELKIMLGKSAFVRDGV